MKKYLSCTAVALVALTGSAQAEIKLKVGGVDYPLIDLMENCATANGGPDVKLACYDTLTTMLRDQGGGADKGVAVAEALENLRTVAEYSDDGSGLTIEGNDCKVNVVYYNNYFHLSRRNVSSIDLFGAEFDASRLQFEQISQVQGQTMTWSKGLMQIGTTATSRGGADLGSVVQLPQKPASASVADYANAIVGQLPARQEQTFDFVLVHPERREATVEIWQAFETFANACRGRPSS